MHTDNRAETITFRYFKPNHHVSLTLTKCLLCRDIRTAEDPGGLLKPVSFHSWIVDTKARFMRQKCTKADSVTGDQTDVRCSTSSSQVLSSSDTSCWVQMSALCQVGAWGVLSRCKTENVLHENVSAPTTTHIQEESTALIVTNEKYTQGVNLLLMSS